MNLRFYGCWLTVDKDDAEEVVQKLADGGMKLNTDFKIYYPGYNSIVTGKQHTSLGVATFLFCGDSGNEVLARMIL